MIKYDFFFSLIARIHYKIQTARNPLKSKLICQRDQRVVCIRTRIIREIEAIELLELD